MKLSLVLAVGFATLGLGAPNEIKLRSTSCLEILRREDILKARQQGCPQSTASTGSGCRAESWPERNLCCCSGCNEVCILL